MEAVPDWDAVTLGQFLNALPQDLVVLHDGGNADAPVRWVEPSELEDPTPYLLDNEFVLTAGLPFLGPGGTKEEVQVYVRRLVGAGVAALGFCLEPYFQAVPDQVLIACQAHQLTLVQIPSSVPFAAIGLVFSQLLESRKARAFRQLADTNRQLMRAVLSARPEHELLAALVQRVPVWAQLFGIDGRIRASAAAVGTDRTAAASVVDSSALEPILKRLLAGNGPRVETDSLPAEGSPHVFGHPLRSIQDATLGALIVGAYDPLTPPQNTAVSMVVGLLELLMRQRASGSLAPSQLATALFLHPASVTNGSSRQQGVFNNLMAQSVTGTASGSLRVIQGLRLDDADGPARAFTDSPVRTLLQLRRLFETKMVEITDYGFAAITGLRVDEALLQEVESLGWRLVVGDPTDMAGLSAAYQRAATLRPRVKANCASVRVDDVTWSVSGLLGRRAGAMMAARVLAPVLVQDPDRRRSQLVVLKSWLGENGNWDATARILNVHRNSVRRQITTVAKLLGMDFDSAQVRAELWFALQYVDDLDNETVEFFCLPSSE